MIVISRLLFLLAVNTALEIFENYRIECRMQELAQVGSQFEPKTEKLVQVRSQIYNII